MKMRDYVRIAAEAGVDPRIAKLVLTSPEYAQKRARLATRDCVQRAAKKLGYPKTRASYAR